MERKKLEKYLKQGYSSRKIASLEDRSQTTILYWVNKFGLATKKKPIPNCLSCGNPIKNYRSPKIVCDHECAAILRKRQGSDRVESGTACSNTIRRYLMENVETVKCSSCDLETWQGKEIVFDVDHIDGNSDNNSLDNLRLLCPNCHSQTSTYKALNKGNGREKRRKACVA